MNKKFKTRLDLLFHITGQHVKKYHVLLFTTLSIILFAVIFGIVGWYYSPDVVSPTIEIMFYISRGAVFVVTSIAVIFLIFARLEKIKESFLAVATHFYITFMFIWGVLVFCFDLSLGFAPLTYLLVATFIAGIFIVDPYYFVVLELLSLIPISISIFNDREMFFSDELFAENMILFVLFLVLSIVTCFKNYRVFINEYRIQDRLEELSYIDGLTGLLNERSYVDVVEDVDRRIDAGEDVKFAVILMDVNNLKATNDKYGHRYGCSLVVRCGQMLPTIFQSSKIYHVGGDEFIVIVMDDDLKDFENKMKIFDDAMLYSKFKYEGKELIFSVARGYHIKEEGQHYKDVVQIADSLMYENKKYLKEKYNMKGR